MTDEQMIEWLEHEGAVNSMAKARPIFKDIAARLREAVARAGIVHTILKEARPHIARDVMQRAFDGHELTAHDGKALLARIDAALATRTALENTP